MLSAGRKLWRRSPVYSERSPSLLELTAMRISKNEVAGNVEYTKHSDGTWSFVLTLDDDPVPIESTSNFATRELAEEQVNYELESASLRKAEG